MKIPYFSLLILLLTTPQALAKEIITSTEKGSKVVNDESKGDSVELEIFDLKILGQLKNPVTPDFIHYVGIGLGCAGCKDQKKIVLFRLKKYETPSYYTYPGKIFGKDQSLLHSSRTFYGNCISGRPEGLFVFQQDRADRKRKLEQSVMVVEPSDLGVHKVTEKLIERRPPKIENTITKVRQKNCFEIESWTRKMNRGFFSKYPSADLKD
jgi:hypothetical protein